VTGFAKDGRDRRFSRALIERPLQSSGSLSRRPQNFSRIERRN
jgi:hypothetical protein